MKYVYTMQGPIVVLADVEEISTVMFNSPESLESELKEPSPSGLYGNVLYIKLKDGRFFVVDLDDDFNKNLAGIHDYSTIPNIIRTKIIESWLEVTGKMP